MESYLSKTVLTVNTPLSGVIIIELLKIISSEIKSLFKISELLSNTENIENPKGYVKMNLLSDLAADYEETSHPIQPPTLSEAIKFRIQE